MSYESEVFNFLFIDKIKLNILHYTHDSGLYSYYLNCLKQISALTEDWTRDFYYLVINLKQNGGHKKISAFQYLLDSNYLIIIIIIIYVTQIIGILPHEVSG